MLPVRLLLGLTSSPESAVADADRPTVEPATGGGGAPTMDNDVRGTDYAIGYETADFPVSGDAHSYATAAPLTSDGLSNVPGNNDQERPGAG